MIADEYCTAGSKDYRGIRENAFRQFKKFFSPSFIYDFSMKDADGHKWNAFHM